MKTIVFTGIFLFMASLALAEQRVVTVYTQAEWGGGTKNLEFACKKFCSQGGDINSWLSKGWRVIDTHRAEITNTHFTYENTWCRCIGKEYVIEK